jgi:penicillin-binding protein 2
MLTLLSSSREQAAYRARLRLFGAVVLIAFLGILGRIAHMQLVRGNDYASMSRDNFVRVVQLLPDRGLIKDVRGRTVAGNRPSYTVYVTPHFLERGAGVLERVIDTVGLSKDDAGRLRRQVNGAKGLDRFERILVRRDVHRDVLALVETNRRELLGVSVEATSHRTYPFGRLAGHLVGYMNEINERELGERAKENYRPGDYVGRYGMERAYEPRLRGFPGLESVVVDAVGMRRDLRALVAAGGAAPDPVLAEFSEAEFRREAVPGKNLVLTMDMKLQRIMQRAMRNHKSGALVALEPSTGRLLGMYSKPTFGPNAWTGRLSKAEKDEVDENPFKPMINKAVWSYFPGSVYKIVTALAALEEEVVSPEEEIDCPGYYKFGKRVFRCWERGGHGLMNIESALQHSCDVWFYVAGERLGIDRLARYAKAMGFGVKSGLDLNGASAGLVPTRAWHSKHSSDGFQHGFTLNTAVGQGDTRATPLQTALAYAALANGGTLYYPQAMERIETADGRSLIEFKPRVRRQLGFAAENLRIVNDGLIASVHEEGGTSYESRLDHLRVAGKTGTAQVRGLRSRVQVDEDQRFRLRDHAWYVGYAPADSPQIVVVAFLEHGGSGGKHAAPVALEVIDRYFRDVLGVVPGPSTASYRRRRASGVGSGSSALQ